MLSFTELIKKKTIFIWKNHYLKKLKSNNFNGKKTTFIINIVKNTILTKSVNFLNMIFVYF